MKKIKELIERFIQGFCMALADSVPGVSGGTIAFIMGFYDKFINSLDNLLRGDSKEKKQALKFLIKLGIGWIVGFLISATILSTLFNSKIYVLSSLFLGFIIFAIPVVIREEKDEVIGKYKNIIFLVLGMLFVVLISFLNSNGSLIEIGHLNKLNLGLVIYVFLAGAVAITAMILPGISGSTLLLIFGLYIPIMNAVKNILKFDFSYIPVLIIFGLGIVVGCLTSVKLLRKCLEKYRSQTIYTVIGMMLGSIYAIAMGPTTLDEPMKMLSFSNFNIMFFILGAVIIICLEKIKEFLEK
ncbi:MAG: DUF368 domain-containing protein [Bacilli bacterium]